MLITRHRQRLGDLLARTVVAVQIPRQPDEEAGEDAPFPTDRPDNGSDKG